MNLYVPEFIGEMVAVIDNRSKDLWKITKIDVKMLLITIISNDVEQKRVLW